MKCVILAAGEGVRMRPLTLNTPKPMLPLAGVPLLARIVRSLPAEISEIIMVVGYLGQVIQDYFRDSFEGRTIRYIRQEKKLGTWNAVKLAEPLLTEDYFLMVYGDDLFGPLSYERCVRKGKFCVLLARAEHPERFGVVTVNPDGTIREIVEKPKQPKGNLVSCGPAVLPKDIFKYPPPRNPNGEYYVPDSINLMVKDGYKVYTDECDWWIPIAYPEDLKNAEAFLMKNKVKS